MKLKYQLLLFFGGLIIFSYGIANAIQVQHLGTNPWDVLHIALYDRFGLSIGTWTILIGLIMVTMTWFLNRKYVNIGTLINAIIVGPIIDFFLFIGFFPHSNHTITDILILLMAIVLMGVGGGMYVASNIGAGPRDGFMMSVSEKLGISISKVRIIVESSVLVVGLLLGGPVFIFTFVYTFIQSPIFQRSYIFFTKWLDHTSSTNVHGQI